MTSRALDRATRALAHDAWEEVLQRVTSGEDVARAEIAAALQQLARERPGVAVERATVRLKEALGRARDDAQIARLEADLDKLTKLYHDLRAKHAEELRYLQVQRMYPLSAKIKALKAERAK